MIKFISEKIKQWELHSQHQLMAIISDNNKIKAYKDKHCYSSRFLVLLRDLNTLIHHLNCIVQLQ